MSNNDNKKGFVFEKLPLDGSYLITPFSSFDLRGAFIKDYSKQVFLENNIDYELKEVFYTISKAGVIRAIHFQENNQQPKLVRCVKGKVFDVIVDLRPESATFKQWIGIYLTGDNMKEILIPAHFGHGYLVIEDSIVSYKCQESFDSKNDSGIIYNDNEINIKWPFEEIGGIKNLIISEKDKNLQSFSEYYKKGCK